MGQAGDFTEEVHAHVATSDLDMYPCNSFYIALRVAKDEFRDVLELVGSSGRTGGIRIISVTGHDIVNFEIGKMVDSSYDVDGLAGAVAASIHMALVAIFGGYRADLGIPFSIEVA